MNENYGLYIFTINAKILKQIKIVSKVQNYLVIGDVHLQIDRSKELSYKEVICSYKTIYMNTYTVASFCLGSEIGSNIVYMHESFQLWESQIYSIFLSKYKDFVTLNKDGIELLSVGGPETRNIKNTKG